MTANEILNIIKTAKENGYRFFGIRALSDDQESIKNGDHLRNSYDWDIDNDISAYSTTGETLNGACAVSIDRDGFFLSQNEEEDDINAVEAAMMDAQPYGSRLALIASRDGYDYGQDENEIILEDADVLAVID